MYRGTTPLHRFTFDLPKETVNAIYITYKQSGQLRIEKSKEDITFEDGYISVKLSQEETLKFTEIGPVEIQIRFTDMSENAYASNVITTKVDRILKEGVI